MKKDAYYFPHFSNSRNDSKVIKLRRVLGIEGYGLYFMLLEVLREQTEFKFPLSGIEDLAYEWHISKEKIISVVNDYDLFQITDNTFFSPKLMLYLQPYLEKSERARFAARKRWDEVNANAHANALPEHSKSNANQNASKVKESKVKESKEEYIYNKFYDKQIKTSNKDENYISFIKILFGDNETSQPLENVLKMKDQCTYRQFQAIYNYKLNKKIIVSEFLIRMNNWKDLNKKNTSLQSTLLNWMRKDEK